MIDLQLEQMSFHGGIHFGLLAMLGLALYIVILILCLVELAKIVRLLPDTVNKPGVGMVWCCIIPFAGYILMWIVFPFKLPNAIVEHGGEDSELGQAAGQLKIWGLIFVIGVLLGGLIPFIGHFVGPALLLVYFLKAKKVTELLTTGSSAGTAPPKEEAAVEEKTE